MNNKKRNLILWAAITNLILSTASLVVSILITVFWDDIPEWLYTMYNIFYSITLHDTSNLIYTVLCFAFGLVGSILLFWAIRSHGKYFRKSQGVYITGFVFIVIFGGWIPWILLLISMFIPDVIVMNSKSELRREDKEEFSQMQKSQKEHDAMIEEKRKKIDDLKRLRDEGLISEEEYKEKLFEIL